MDVDPVWEYNAPQFVDFSHPMDDDPGADEYFDVDHEDENVVMDADRELKVHSNSDQIDSCSTFGVENAKTSSCDGTVAVQTEKTKDLVADDVKLSGQSQDYKLEDKVSSTCVIMEHQNAVSAGSNEDEPSSNAEEMKVGSQQPQMPTPKNSQRENNVGENSSRKDSKNSSCRPRTRSFDLGQLVQKSSRKNPESSQRMSGSHESSVTETTGKVTVAKQRRSQSQDRLERSISPSGKSKKTYSGKLTMPQTPSFMKRELKFLHLNPVKPTEDQEMDKIRALRRALVEKRKLAAESRVTALTSTGYAPVHSKQPVTRPQEFKFASDARLKGPTAENGAMPAWKEVDFTNELRKHSDQTAAVTSGKTIPVPFNLHASRKRRSSDNNPQSKEEKFETMAEKVIKFSSKTPDRFRAKPANDRRSADCQSKSSEQDTRQLTIPKTPNLVTRSRARPVDIPSQADKEEMELEQIRKNKIKALPFNPKIFENSKLGVKKVTPKAPTKPEPFDLEIERRVQQRKRHHSDSANDQQYEFHAQPVPKKILLGPVGVNPVKEIPLTVPQSPAFTTKYQLRSTVKEDEPKVEKVQNLVKAHPVPHVGIPFQPKLDHQVTVVEPFSFEQRNKEMQNKKEQLIKKVFEEEKKAREFHAQPLKDLQPVLPERKVRRPTTPEPFNLEIETRCAARIEEWKQKLQEDENKKKMAALFKARPPSVLEKEPFIPEKSSKPPTEMTDIQLNTEKRAEKRQDWEAWNNEKLTELELERKREEKAKMEEMEKEMQKMRSEAVPKANPIRQYKAVHIVPSDQSLTNPESPRFSERLKTKSLRH